MAETQIIHTPSGEDLVVLSRADYDALVRASDAFDEDASDVEMFDQRVAEQTCGHDSVLPPPVSEGLLRGQSRLKAIRKWRGLTQAVLAQRAGIAQGYMSELESRQKTGTPETVAALADALDVPVAWLS